MNDNNTGNGAKCVSIGLLVLLGLLFLLTRVLKFRFVMGVND
jgi:hypothetical protein